MLSEFEIKDLARKKSTTNKKMVEATFETVSDLFDSYQEALFQDFEPESNLQGDSFISLYVEMLGQISDLQKFIFSEDFTGSGDEETVIADISTSMKETLSRMGSLVGLPPTSLWKKSKTPNGTLRVIK